MPTVNRRNPWVAATLSAGHPQLRLYCFPYAGRGASLYYPWARELQPTIDVLPIQLPGREGRLSERAITAMPELVEAVCDAIEPEPQVPFALFGHSMGGLIAFEVARALQRRERVPPVALIVSGSYHPTMRPALPSVRDAPDDVLLARLRDLNGTPSQVLENAELVELILPIFRADTTLLESYELTNADALSCPIHVFVGAADHKVTRRQALPWACETSSLFTLQTLPGDHYFIQSSRGALLRAVRDLLGRTQLDQNIRARVYP